MRTESEVVALLNTQWSDTGFLGRLRGLKVDLEARDRFLDTLRSIDRLEADRVSLELVRLLWFMPTFLQWRKERLGEAFAPIAGVDDLTVNELQRIFGMP